MNEVDLQMNVAQAKNFLSNPEQLKGTTKATPREENLYKELTAF